MTFKEWWDRAMGDYVIIDDYLDAYRAGQAEMRERAAVLAGGDVGYEIADLPLEGDDD